LLVPEGVVRHGALVAQAMAWATVTAGCGKWETAYKRY